MARFPIGPAAAVSFGLAPAAAAADGPGPPPLAVPPDLGVALLGGADAWTGGGGPASELRAGASAHRPLVDASASGALELVEDAGVALFLDQLRAGVGLRTAGGLAARSGLTVGGSIATGWFDATATAGVEARSGGARAALGGGAGVRAVAAVVGPEGLSTARLDLHHGALGSTSTASARVFGGALPPVVLDAGQWLALGSDHRVELGAVLSSVPTSSALPVAGLPAPGTTVLQGLVAGELALDDRWRLRIEVGPEVAWGALPYERLRAFGGLRGDLGRSLAPAPGRASDGRTRFELRAPDAESVELLASFDDWRPLPMTREGRVWAVEVDLPAGSWEFTFRVDGELVVPPSADRYVPDGFGGTNGVVAGP